MKASSASDLKVVMIAGSLSAPFYDTYELRCTGVLFTDVVALTKRKCSGYDPTQAPSVHHWRLGDSRQVSHKA